MAQLVERHLAKVEVAGSSPVSRSKFIKIKSTPFRCAFYLYTFELGSVLEGSRSTFHSGGP